ncbi:hypothetical protein BUE76_02075 [Cnuella takakiae]|nr:hypothetical protein BUE76_02075 [Cnuella takakiae]
MCAFTLKAASQLYLPPARDSLPVAKTVVLLPQNFYTQHMPFSCKKEYQLQKITRLNLFIRLGNKEYVDRMEGKKQ